MSRPWSRRLPYYPEAKRLDQEFDDIEVQEQAAIEEILLKNIKAIDQP